MKYHKITIKATGETMEAKTLKSICQLAGLNYNSVKSRRTVTGSKDFENKRVKIEQLVMIK